MERNLKAIVRYDGTGFAGWQVQPDERTVQGELERVLTSIARQPVRVHGAGRTDAGVHALAQVCSFAWPSEVPAERVRRSVSKMLGPEIRMVSVSEAGSEFHARKSAVGKRYAYTICLAKEPDPFSARYAWCVPGEVDPARLAALARGLEGEHDFAGFQGSCPPKHSTVRTIHAIEIRKGGVIGPEDASDLWCIDFHGNGFLYKMVRNITGTLVDVARGKVPEERIQELLGAPGPYRGFTAPGQGLALTEVIY